MQTLKERGSIIHSERHRLPWKSLEEVCRHANPTASAAQARQHLAGEASKSMLCPVFALLGWSRVRTEEHLGSTAVREPLDSRLLVLSDAVAGCDSLAHGSGACAACLEGSGWLVLSCASVARSELEHAGHAAAAVFAALSPKSQHKLISPKKSDLPISLNYGIYLKLQPDPYNDLRYIPQGILEDLLSFESASASIPLLQGQMGA